MSVLFQTQLTPIAASKVTVLSAQIAVSFPKSTTGSVNITASTDILTAEEHP